MKPSRLRSLVMSEFSYINDYDEVVVKPTNGAYGEAVAALDAGDAVSILDVIDAEESLKLIDDDEAAKAAMCLAMCGWHPSALGGLFSQRLAKGRPGRRLLSDAIQMIEVRQRLAYLDEQKRRQEMG